MKICCAICWTVLTQNDETVNSTCGHVFHSLCLLQWFEKSYTCPQCRTEISPKLTSKLYFTFVHSETKKDNDCPKQQKIDNLNFKLLLNERNTDYYICKNKSLKSQNAGLRHEVQRVESELRKKSSIIYDLKEVLQTYKRKYEETKKKNTILLESRKQEKIRKYVHLDRSCVKASMAEDNKEGTSKTNSHKLINHTVNKPM